MPVNDPSPAGEPAGEPREIGGSAAPYPLRLFGGYGIEIEEMIVDADTLDVRPWSDRALLDDAGNIVGDVSRGVVAWCNELAAHVIELKNDGPAPSLDGLVDEFQSSIREIDARLRRHGARLMPTGMHPWMDPMREAVLWQHEWSAVYEAFDRIFDRRGHGWSNLQSVQINLPFGDDAEFARLHAAIRLVLPILPALTASTPFVEGAAAGSLDNRMRFYRTNCVRVPSVSGHVVPENWRTRADYEGILLAGIHRDIEPLDTEGVLRHEWINARGSIARFDRGAIEIRILDTQESPAADIAVLAAIVGVVRSLCEGRLVDLDAQCAFDTERLATILWQVVDAGDRATLTDVEYLSALGLDATPMSALDAWRELIARHLPADHHDVARWRGALDVILNQGCLARRILAATGAAPSRDRLREVYRDLCECLLEGRSFG